MSHQHRHQIQKSVHNEPSNHNDSHGNGNNRIGSEQYNNAINQPQECMKRNNQYLHQQNKLNHNYNQHTFNHNNKNKSNYSKSNKRSLSFEDEIYLIFHENGYKPLFFEKIKKTLFYKFSVNNIDYSDIKKLRFLYITNNKSFKIHPKQDDICRHGFKCNLQNGKCQRIHAIVKGHVCHKPLNYKTMTCHDSNCSLIHYQRRRITNIFLELILFIYNEHLNHNKDLRLQNFCISDREFIETYYRFYIGAPIPNITHLHWKRIIGLYSKYYYDYQQQSDDPQNMRSSVVLWRTDFDHNNNKKMGPWHITIHHNPQFFEDRTCHHFLFNSIDHQRYIKCHFHQYYFCPYFHLKSKYVSIDGHCKDCIYGNIYRRCHRFHFKNPNYLKQSYPLPATCWTRPIQQLNMEINHIMFGQKEDINIIMLNKKDIECHNIWCNQLDFIYNQHRNKHPNNSSICNVDIYNGPLIDTLIDNGFHDKHDGINIFWDLSQIKAFKPFEIIQSLFSFFHENGHQKMTDIDLPGIEKVIILRYKVEAFKDVFIKIAHSLQRLPKQWCFNRRISFNVKYDGVYMIFEFSNVNTFLSVQSMKQWFHSFIANYYEFFGDKLLSFDSGSYHFVHRHQSSISSTVSTAYFYEMDINPKSLTNLKMNGISIKLLQPLHPTVFSKNIHNLDTKFINYGDPKIYSYLVKNDKLYLHDQQSNRMILQNIEHQQTVQTVQDYHGYDGNNDIKSSHTNIEQKIHNAPRVQTVPHHHEYDSFDDSPPPTHYKNNNKNNNDNVKRMEILENKEENEQINNDEIKNIKYQYTESDYDYSESSDHDRIYYQQYQINNNNDDIKSKITDTIRNRCCNDDIGNTKIQNNASKDDGVSNEYCNLTKILQLKHKKCGNAKKSNKDKQYFSAQCLNELCRYCLMAIYTEKHKEECFFIPQWVKEGRSKPFNKIKNFMIFNGHHYLQKTNDDS